MRRDFSQAGIREIDSGGSRHPRNVIGVDADAAFATRRTVFVVSVAVKKVLQLITGAPVMFASEDDRTPGLDRSVAITYATSRALSVAP